MLTVLLIVLLPVVDAGGGAWVDDEALYGLQVDALRDGGWGRWYHGVAFDPEGEWRPIVRVGMVDGRYYPYVKHPAYAVLLWSSAVFFGTGYGLYAVSIAGLVLTAIATWLLACELEPRAGPVAFWLVGGSPLIINAYLLWGHTLSAAAAAGALAVVVRVVRRGVSARRVGALCALIAAGVLLRSEMVLFAVSAAAATAGAFAVRARRSPPQAQARRWLLIAVVPAAVIGTVAVTVVAEHWLIGQIVHGGGSATLADRAAGAPIEARLRASWTVTMSGSESFAGASYPIVGAIACVAAIVIAWKAGVRAQRLRALLVPATLIVAALYAVRMAVYSREPARGMFAAWPAAPLGLLAVPWRRNREAHLVLVAITALFGLAICATQYDVAGGTEWGGRFLSPVVPALAAIIAAGVSEAMLTLPHRSDLRRDVTVIAIVVTAAPAVAGLWMLNRDNRYHRGATDAVYGVATRTVVVQGPPDGAHPIQRLPIHGWRRQRDHDVFWSRSPETGPIIDALFANGYDDITVVHDPASRATIKTPATADDVTPALLRDRGVGVHVLHRSEPIATGITDST